MNNMEEMYQQITALKKAYDAAKEAGDEAKMTEIRNEYDEKFAENRTHIFNLYEESRDAGNEYLDVDDCIHHADKFIAELNEAEVVKFTMSSTWSSAVEVAYEFEKAGFKVVGMTEINHKHLDIDFSTGKTFRKTKPAFVFEKAVA